MDSCLHKDTSAKNSAIKSSAPRPIDSKKASEILSPSGPLSLLLDKYEFRSEQQQMLQDIVEAYNHNHISLIEAGTGIGKSMAYLIPAILWSVQNKERTLISTNTISLQEQLFYKDIPLASKIINSPIKAVIVKGMSNYLCFRKLEELKYEKAFLSYQEQKELEHIQYLSEQTKEGSRSNLSLFPSSPIWEKVCAEADSCTHRRCPFFKNCYFFNARKEAEEAHILIANHSMLFADLEYRKNNNDPEGGGLLPPYTKVIVDEAHHIEKIATEFFADKVSHLPILKWLGRLGAEKQGRLAALSQKFLKQFLHHMPHEVSQIYSRLSIDIPSLRKDLLEQIHETFEALTFFLRSILCEESETENLKTRILPHHIKAPHWKEEIVPKVQLLTVSLKRYTQSIRSLMRDISLLNEPKFLEQIYGIQQEIQALSNRLEQMMDNFEKMVNFSEERSKVMWMESQALKTFTNTQLIHADLEIAQKLYIALFEPFSSVVLCSATLTTNNNFTFIKKRWGLSAEQSIQKTVQEKIYSSPFDYQKQVLFLIPKDIPDPSDPNFYEAACEKIKSCLNASQGGAFLLFTSYGMMKKCYDILALSLKEQKFSLFKQGDAARNTLLEAFKKSSKGVLFGTDSFWEGVDVVGKALRCVIIVKLPFQVPTEPLIQARTEYITEKGGSSFHDYMIPTAIVKFKQGFGRLIRHKQDRGCLVCLDVRLMTKNYGNLFLKSLPPCNLSISETDEEFQSRIKEYYQKNWGFFK